MSVCQLFRKNSKLGKKLSINHKKIHIWYHHNRNNPQNKHNQVFLMHSIKKNKTHVDCFSQKNIKKVNQ